MENTNVIKNENPEIFISRRKAAREAERRELMMELEKGVKLGNFHSEPIILEYYDKHGNFFKSETILSTVTEKFAVTRGDKFIPIDYIKKVIV